MPGGAVHPARPLVSIIIALRNYARYLPDAVTSVTEQDYRDWECVIVDDGSTDDSLGVAQRLAHRDARIRVEHQSPSGPSAARNRGLARSRGSLIQFLDADDLLSPDKLRQHVDVLETEPAFDIVYGPTGTFQPSVIAPTNVAAASPSDTSMTSHSVDMLDRLVVSNVMTIEAPLIRRTVFEAVGGFDQSLQRLEDWDLWLRMAIAGKRFAYLPSARPTALIRLHAESHGSVSSAEYFPDLARMRRKAHERLPKDLRRINRCMLLDAQAGAGIAVANGGNPGRGLRMLIGATLVEPRPLRLAWSVAIAFMLLPGGTRLVGAVRTARRSGQSNKPRATT